MKRMCLGVVLVLGVCLLPGALLGQVEELEPIDSDVCQDCHEETAHGTPYGEEVTRSVHDGLDCLSCHQDKDTMPHKPGSEFTPGCMACRSCHDEAAQQYQSHGRFEVGKCSDMPQCLDCHGSHDVLHSDEKQSRTHPVNLPATCGRCHSDVDLVEKYELFINKPILLYENSVHGKATKGGIYVAATCNDCHSSNGTAHKILSPGDPDSAINHFNIPETCGKCHAGVENDFWEGIHGHLVARGETDAPVCTTCHGEHGIISPDDPLSPVSRSRLAESTCSRCHESAVLNEKYGMPTERLRTFIDSYHGLKSKAGDTHVANCASCHGVHRILPSSAPTSTINPMNLQHTCGECHPGISKTLAAQPIHGVSGVGLRTDAAEVVEKVYIVAIAVIIGLMVLHWFIDLQHEIRKVLKKRPQIRRMHLDELWQHTLLMVSFVVLVVSGFSLRFSDGFLAKFFFGWEGGFELRGVVHRISSVVFMGTVAWHMVYLLTSRGRRFLVDMFPRPLDFSQFMRKILYNLGLRRTGPRFGRFSYVEKAEYWALVWGTAVMIVTGLFLWFDNWFVQFLPKGVLDVALVIHYWEAWLATLAIFVWHFYSTVFSPRVYPMNPAWLSGSMPEAMYRHHFPDHVEVARKETEEFIQKQVERLAEIEEAEELNGLEEIGEMDEMEEPDKEEGDSPDHS